MEAYLWAVGVFVLFWLLNQWRSRRFVSLAKKIPSNILHTWLGCGPILSRKNTANYITEHGNKYGKNSVIWIGPFAFFLTTDHISIKDIFNSKNCSGKPKEFIKAFQSTSGNGIILSNDPEWSVHRKLLNPAFSNKNVLSFITIFNRETNNLLQRMDNDDRVGNNPDMLQLFSELTFSIVTQTVLKRRISGDGKILSELTKNLMGAVYYILDLGFNVAWKFQMMRKLLEKSIYKDPIKNINAFKDFISNSIELAATQSSSDSNYVKEINSGIDFAINGFKQNKVNLRGMEDEVLQLYLAAFETTSNTLYIIIVLLAMYPEYQERVVEEITSVFYEDEETEVTYEKVEELIYMDMIINETLRVFPSIPQLIRCVHGEKVVLSNGITLPEGQNIIIDIYNLHRNKELWGPGANRFNPDNFLPTKNATRPAYAFVPFAKGIRVCIGSKFVLLSIKVTLAKLLKKYKFSTDYKYENLKTESFISMKFVEQPPLKIERR